MGKGVTVFGSFVTDLMARSNTLPEPGETVMGNFFKISPGGKGSNQAIAAKRAGADVDIVTKVGRDQFQKLAFESFGNEGISTEFIFLDDDKSTGIALILVAEDTGQNIITVVPGASYNIKESDIEKAKEIILKNDYILLQLENNLDATMKVIELAHERSIKIVLNPAPVVPLPEELYKKIYVITPNESEAERLTGIKIKNEDDIKKACEVFHKKGLDNVIITLGEKGAYLSTPETKRWLEPIEVDVVDTTGAGDAFNGGFVAGLANGMSIIEACEYGMIVGGLSVTKMGTSISMPTMLEIQEYITSNVE